LDEQWTWQPLFEVNTTAGETATIVLISNIAVLYSSPSEDPIFPVELPSYGWYVNSRLHSSVLGCMDRTNICTPNGSFCAGLDYWRNLGLIDNEDSMVIAFLSISLRSSTMGLAIRYRQEGALDANRRRSGPVSLNLDDEQWKTEVLQLFQTSLARIQIDARNLARGNPDAPTYGLSNMIDVYPPLRNLCRIYKFKSTGWRNINVSGFIGATFAGIIVLLLSRTTEDEKELRIEGYYRRLRELKLRDAFEKRWGTSMRRCKEFVKWICKRLERGVQLLKEIQKVMKRSQRATASSASRERLNTVSEQYSDGIALDQH
jgi:hypothetical protein